MTDIPEHLLRRSQERRAALGLGGEGGDAAPAAPAAGASGDAGVPTTTAAAEVATPAAAVVAVPEPIAPPPPYVQASLRRPRVPTFAIPVLAALPVWALIYAGTFNQPAEQLDPVVARGKSVYAANCSGCHGAAGGGGSGRPLTSVIETFPDRADHIAWVVNGSPAAGTPYGAPGRAGGQRLSQSDGYAAMPAFGESLSEEDIAAVVRYEREVLGGEEPGAEGAAEGAPDGSQTGAPDAKAGATGTDSQRAGGSGGNVGSSTTAPSPGKAKGTNQSETPK